MRGRKTLREKIEARIASKPGEDVFLPCKFRDLGGRDKVLRVVRPSRAGEVASCGLAMAWGAKKRPQH